jgi:hypothetical protein
VLAAGALIGHYWDFSATLEGPASTARRRDHLHTVTTSLGCFIPLSHLISQVAGLPVFGCRFSMIANEFPCATLCQQKRLTRPGPPPAPVVSPDLSSNSRPWQDLYNRSTSSVWVMPEYQILPVYSGAIQAALASVHRFGAVLNDLPPPSSLTSTARRCPLPGSR